MEARPRIAVPPTPADKAIERMAWAALALLWGLTIWYLSRLPATIPVHFNAAGVPNRYGEKSSLLELPVIASVLFAGLTAVSNYPHLFNYLTEITPANALTNYRGAIRLLRGLKIGMVLVFLLLVWQTGQTAAGQACGLGPWLLPAALGLLLLAPLWGLLTMLRTRSQQ